MHLTSRRHARPHFASTATWAAALIALAVGILDAQSVSAADSGDTLRLATIYARADSASPRLIIARAEARAAEARVAGTARPPDPMLQLAVMNRALPGLAPMPYTGMTQLQLTQMLPVAGQLGLAKKFAAARAGAAGDRVIETRRDARARAAMTFYELYAATQSIRVATETRELLRDLDRAVQTMYSVGRGRQADVLRAQVEVARMTEVIIRMRTMRTILLARLEAELGGPVADSSTPIARPRFPSALPSLDTLVEHAAADRGMVRAARNDLRAAGASARLAQRSIWPDVELGLQFAWQGNGAGGTDYMGGLMIGASVPVFAGSRQLRMREETVAMQQAAAAEVREALADTRARLTQAYAEVERARRLDALYRATILPQAEAALGASLAAYRTGSVDFMTLVENQMIVNRYRQELFALEAEQGTAIADLEMLTGEQLVDAASTADVAREETER